MRIFRFIFVFLTIPLFSQVSDEGRFSADFAAGCAPFTINLTELIPVGTIRQYSYEDPDDFTSALSYTYTTPGSFDIVQVHNDDGVNPKTDTLRITVLDGTPPNFNYFYCDAREVQVEIDDPTYDQYEITFAGSSSNTVSNQGTATYSYGAGDPLSIEVRGIFNGAKDNCSPTTIVLASVIDNLTAPTIQTANIAQTCENRFDLSLTANTDENVIYQVQFAQGGDTQTLHEGTLENESVFQVSNLDQSADGFDVTMNAYNICDETYISGAPFSISNASGLEPVQNLYSTYQGNDVLISLNDASIGRYAFERSFDEQSYSLLAHSRSSHLDEKVFFGRQYFYRVSYLDTCSGTWGTQNTAPPFIRAVEIEPNKYQVTLDEASFPSNEPVSYTAVLSGNGGSVESSVSGGSFEISVPSNLGTKPTLIVTGGSESYQFSSNTVELKYEFLIQVPKAFTPNGDGLNDRLEFFGIDNSQAELKIYNRWGQQIYYEISSAPAWDGRINGEVTNEGIYIYEISVPQISNQKQRGIFALIKR